MAIEDSDIEKILSEIDNEDTEKEKNEKKGDEYSSVSELESIYSIDNEGLDAPIDLTDEIDDLDDINENEIEKDEIFDNVINDKDIDITENKSLPISDEKEIKSSQYAYDNFTLVGTKSWNRKEPYIIQINNEVLHTDYEYLQKSFYFIVKQDTNDKLKKDIKASLARFMRKPGTAIINEYEEFIFKAIISVNNELVSYFKIDDNLKNLFIYHLGPLNIYKIIIEKFIINGFGYCFRYEMQTGKGIKFLPEEFVKEKILAWFQGNINSLSLPFDSIQNFDKIVKTIDRSYNIIKRNFLIRLDKLNNQLDPAKQITSRELIKIKGNKWFGIQNIITYKRFIEKNIFI